MITRTISVLLPVVALLGSLAGCGSTPQAALDQANHGAALTAALESELRALRAAQTSVAQSRLDSIRRLNTSMAQLDAEAAFDARVQKNSSKECARAAVCPTAGVE